MKRIASVSIMGLLMAGLTSAGTETGDIEGWVVDSMTKKPLANVNVFLSESNVGNSTDDNGKFYIQDIDIGLHTLKARMMGYGEKTIHNLRIRAGEIRNVNIEMTQTVIEVESITVTATREPSLVWNVPVSASIISAADLKRRNPITPGEILQEAGGSVVKSYGISGAMETISLRGSSSEQVLVLWDGQRLNSPLTGGLDLSIVSLQPIERIEVLHGGYSSLYGADAMAGVVNFITRQSQLDKRIHGSVHSSLGSYGLQKYAVDLGQRLGRWSYVLSANSIQSDGNFEYTVPNAIDAAKKESLRRQNSDLDSKLIFAKANWDVSNSTKVQMLSEWARVDRGIPGSLIYPTVNGRQQDESTRIHADVQTTPISYLTLRAKTFYHKHDIHYVDESPFFPTDSQNDAESYGVDVQGNINIHRHEVAIGGTYLYESGQGNDIGTRERDTMAFFAHGQLDLSSDKILKNIHTILMPSLRYDHFPDFNNVVNPQIGFLISKHGSSPLGLRMSWGKSFRIPTFNELYWVWGGNPNLKPEKATNFEVGLRAGFSVADGLEFDASYFNKDATDWIQWVEDKGTGFWLPNNVSAAHVNGVDLSLSCRGLARIITTEINYSRLYSENRSGIAGVNGKKLIYRPMHSGNFIASFNFGKTTFTFTTRYMGECFADEINSLKLDSHVLFDGNFGVNPEVAGLRLDVVISVKNIFDKQYQVVKDYPMPGRQLRIQLGLGL